MPFGNINRIGNYIRVAVCGSLQNVVKQPDPGRTVFMKNGNLAPGRAGVTELFQVDFQEWPFIFRNKFEQGLIEHLFPGIA